MVMKRNIIVACVGTLLLSALFAFKITGDDLKIGDSMPKADLKLHDIHDNQISMSDVKKNNGVLVMFSCNTCPYVAKNQERIREICRFAIQNMIGVIVLNSNEGMRAGEESIDAMTIYGKLQLYDWPYAVDKDNIIADAFGAKRTPECFLFNKNLKLLYHGAIDDNPNDPSNVTRQHLKEAINEMLTGKEVTKQLSRSVGCAIKRKG